MPTKRLACCLNKGLLFPVPALPAASLPPSTRRRLGCTGAAASILSLRCKSYYTMYTTHKHLCQLSTPTCSAALFYFSIFFFLFFISFFSISFFSISFGSTRPAGTTIASCIGIVARWRSPFDVAEEGWHVRTGACNKVSSAPAMITIVPHTQPSPSCALLLAIPLDARPQTTPGTMPTRHVSLFLVYRRTRTRLSCVPPCKPTQKPKSRSFPCSLPPSESMPLSQSPWPLGTLLATPSLHHQHQHRCAWASTP